MNATQRRETILSMLTQTSQPLSASTIAKMCGVSRQIIVGDIALLRASGEEISATPRGYVMLRHEHSFFRKTIACCHYDDKMAQELYIVVDNGCAVLDVTVEHPVYGQISGQLQLFSRYDVDQFIHKLHTCNAPPLCALTNGVHLHTIQYPHEDNFKRVLAQLGENGLLFEQNDEG